jgi:hypothetical protein
MASTTFILSFIILAKLGGKSEQSIYQLIYALAKLGGKSEQTIYQLIYALAKLGGKSEQSIYQLIYAPINKTMMQQSMRITNPITSMVQVVTLQWQITGIDSPCRQRGPRWYSDTTDSKKTPHQ